MAQHFDHPAIGSFVDRRGGGGDDGGMEARIARLEADVGHIRSDITVIREDVREVRGKLDSHFIWMIGLGLGAVGLVLGVIAKGFGWL